MLEKNISNKLTRLLAVEKESLFFTGETRTRVLIELIDLISDEALFDAILQWWISIGEIKEKRWQKQVSLSRKPEKDQSLLPLGQKLTNDGLRILFFQLKTFTQI